MKKTDCTSEEWAAYLLYHRNRRLQNLTAEQQKRREYNARPEVKARRKDHDQKPEVLAKKRLRNSSPEAKKIDSMRRKLNRENNPEQHAKRLALQRQRRTNFSPELFTSLIAKQNNRCAICAREFNQRLKPCGDHCHDSGKPRGVLCHTCNSVEGLLGAIGLKPAEFCGRLSRYLENPPANQTTG